MNQMIPCYFALGYCPSLVCVGIIYKKEEVVVSEQNVAFCLNERFSFQTK